MIAPGRRGERTCGFVLGHLSCGTGPCGGRRRFGDRTLGPPLLVGPHCVSAVLAVPARVAAAEARGW